MTIDRWNQIKNIGGWVDLTARAKWQLTGNDRVRYLNGQVTNDVRRATAQAAVYACVTDHKGKIFGDIYVRSTVDCERLLLDAEPVLRESLGARLERYIVADDVECEDVTDGWRLVHAFGAEGGGAMEGGLAVERYGVAGLDFWLRVGEVWNGLPELQLTDEEVEIWRVVHGIPKFPNELNEEGFPPEAGLEVKAIDYSKGCYIGQEIISRMRTTGKMPRTLVRWHGEEETDGIAVGELIYGLDDAERKKPLGSVTSVARHPESRRICGLAYVKQAAVPLHSRLLVGAGMGSISLVN